MGKSYDSKDGRETRGGKATLPLSSIHRDPILRSRVGPLDNDHVSGMADSISAGQPPPRATVFKIGNRGHFLVAGWCTVAAYEATEATEIPVVVIKGTWVEAVDYVSRQNLEYDRVGFKRSQADIRHAAMMLITAHPEWSDRDIAKKIGSTHPTVGKARDRLAEARQEINEVVRFTTPNGGEKKDPIYFRLGQDGKWYPLPIPQRSRDSSRAEHLDDLQPSWESFGGQLLPLLKNNIPLPRVLASNQLNLKQLSFVTGRLLDHFSGPKFCPRAKRMLTDKEKAEDFETIYADIFRELYEGGDEVEKLAERMEAFRDPRFPAGALP